MYNTRLLVAYMVITSLRSAVGPMTLRLGEGRSKKGNRKEAGILNYKRKVAPE
jgi:hypothetical protein